MPEAYGSRMKLTFFSGKLFWYNMKLIFFLENYFWSAKDVQKKISLYAPFLSTKWQMADEEVCCCQMESFDHLVEPRQTRNNLVEPATT